MGCIGLRILSLTMENRMNKSMENEMDMVIAYRVFSIYVGERLGRQTTKRSCYAKLYLSKNNRRCSRHTLGFPITPI